MTLNCMKTYIFLVALFALSLIDPTRASAEDVLVADFESESYGQWKVLGKAFGESPAKGTLDGQHPVSGFLGNQLVNTFLDGDRSTGTATSPSFVIERSHIAFLIGGGKHPETLGIELLVKGKAVRSTTGSDSEALEWSSWDVRDFLGKSVQLRIFDHATGGWGHINVDQIMQTNEPPSQFDLDRKLKEYRRRADYMNEPLRPQFHFSPEINWMNDPNGLVYHDGEYHLFHQYNPAGNIWGHMSWGHAVSPDLTQWKHLPLAIEETDGVMAFSGCCVVDHQNSSGFGSPANPPMVAVYTGHGHGKQVQNLAWSNDRGRTWSVYDQNPVLDVNEEDFRDPKVFWHEPTQRWVMVVSLATQKVLVLYSSQDLKSWTELSRFGPAGVTEKPNWECPDLFELSVEGEQGKKLWVLEADMGSGSVAGGSGGEYFVGTFDGRRFRALQQAQWVDYGRDFYAPISWDNLPPEDGRRIWIGWFNNWETCLVPTSPWRSCMSIPRILGLKKVAFNEEEPATYVLTQKPIEELRALRESTLVLDASMAAWPPVSVIASSDLDELTFELEAILVPGQARSVGIRIRTGKDEYTEIGYDRNYSGAYVDRQQSGNVEFHAAFAGRHHAPARTIDGEVSLQIFVDRSTMEVFINGGEAVISDRIFPTGGTRSVEVFAGDASAEITTLRLHKLRSTWRHNQEQK